MDLLMSDESLTPVWSPDMQWSASAAPEIPCEEVEIVQTPQYAHQAPVATLAPEDTKAELSSSLKEQADDLQKQLAQVREMAQNARQASQDRSEPLNKTLRELAQQVSAIRDYAASQQDRVEKLESGYDWTIIRTFCLRVIRCIDNVEKRIEDLGEEDEATVSLEEIRDELLFAMESSGVERYEPQANSEYRGQEKLAEAVTSRQASNNPELAGKIARVLRAGYRYIVDDDNFKVVRTAQVKLYG
jgi:molecular chaperone GrpE (heat shock protein)